MRRTWSPQTYYRVAEENKERVNFYELYGDETKETVKLMLKVRFKDTLTESVWGGRSRITVNPTRLMC